MKIKSIMKISSLGFLVATNLLMYSTFLIAYFNNNQVLISINKYGEANFELWLMGVFTILSLIVAYWFIKEEKVKYYATN